ncbi:deoxycytidyl transferase [Cladophialophora chaetospira]|uniref:DNA repair protein REV1 n=1 Tax=Cladophialophora chaetospira TaxID=386627 RepID=A0AA38X205_9EURO|nr:deoxycytidyl transferase [Cladophialophora chaetospira]
MGSRLEKNSTLVRKRIENHTFSDEQGEEYEGSKFGGFADYMRRKKIKLQNLDAELRANSADKPLIFRGVVVHVNGYTQPSLNDLHKLVVSHGGGFLQYLDGKTAVTHVVASHLTPKKTVEFGRYRIVKPAWIVDSVEAGRLLPWDSYRLVDEGVTQKVLGFDNGQVVSQASTQRNGYRDQSDTSWYTSQLRQAHRSPSEQNEDDVEFLQQEHLGPQEDKSNQSSAGDQPAISRHVEEATTTAVDGHAIEPEENDRVFVPKPTIQLDDAAKPEKRELTAEEHNAILLSNPHMAKSSTANPDFINQYYRESRLHHLSTWKADLKAQMQARANEKSSSQKMKPKKVPGARRYVMHVDFDSFFAAVSLRKHPQLVEKPVVIAHGSGPGSEIASCNYPARKYGIKNGMWMKTALGMCPDVKVLPYDYDAYEEASRQFYDCILAIDGVVQSISIDEVLLDVSEQCIKIGGSDGKGISEGSLYREQEHVQNLAQGLRAAVNEKTGCDVSVGMGGNILLAKVALRKAKPAGQHLIKPEDVLDFIGELVVTDLPGVAWSIGNKLEEIGIKFVKDIRSFNKEKLINALGPKTGEKIWDYSRGIDKQEVGDQVVRKSVSAEINWGIRFVNQQQAEEFVQSLSDELSRRLLEQLVKGKQLTMKVMRKAADAGMDPPKNLGHGKCDTFNKSVLLGVATNDGAMIGKEAISILRSYNFPPGELRGLGVQMQKLEPLKPSTSATGGFMDASQRRLQFKKPDTQRTQSPAPSEQTRAISARTPKLKDTIDPIEEVPTPEKPRRSPALFGAADSKSVSERENTDQKPLNIGGTQFILPSQIDPAVLAELPSDIRNRLAPRQKSILDIINNPARSASPSDEPLSRSASPQLKDNESMLPNQSQLDPEILAALPPDLRAEVLAQYSKQERKDKHPAHQSVLPQSPHKSRTIGPSKKLVVTPTKKQKAPSLFSKARSKRNGDSSSTLTQSNFVSVPRVEERQAQSDAYVSEDISESFLEELPEDIRLEILAEQKRNRMKAKSGLNYESKKKSRATAQAEANARGQQQLLLPRPPEKPTFTSQKLSSLPDLRDAISNWVREFSADGEGPDLEDVTALSDYLCKVVSVERDMAKATAVVNWLGLVVEYERFDVEDIRLAWEEALALLKTAVQKAVVNRGLPEVLTVAIRHIALIDIMTFPPAWGRKRRPSNPSLPPSTSGRSSNPQFAKKSKLNHVFDGTGSPSVDSTSTGHSKPSMKEQLKKRVRAILSAGERDSDASVQHNPDAMYSITQGTRSAYMLANGSNTTTVHQPLKIRLTAMPDVTECQNTSSVCHLSKSAPMTPGIQKRPEEDEFNFSDTFDDTKRSQSAPGLQRRVSQKFRQAFGNGNSTVVKRANKRSRPSVQTLAMESAAATSTGFSSTPSTLASGSFWSTNANSSTPLTSDPSTPRSVFRRGSMDSFDIERQGSIAEARLLTPIPESTSLPTFTIKTVESAATAKMHLELHFNALFNGVTARELRRLDLDKRMREHHLPPESQTRALKAWEKAESANLRQRRVLKNTFDQTKACEGISRGGFDTIGILGKGSFGVVRLVKAQGDKDEGGSVEGKATDKMPVTKPSRSSLKSSFLSRRRSSVHPKTQVYAMKVIRKSDMIRNGQEGHLRAERDFLVAAEGSRWIIPLIAAFQDRKHLCLVMDYCIGGDFLGLLIRKNVLSEDTTKWYVAEMILCVEEAHRMSWIHRDVKPDNFLIAWDGHLKISDFGLAFDGDWSHDQRFYSKNRQALLDVLGINIDGDELDRQEKQAQSHHTDKRHPQEESMSKEDPATGEPLLDFRNRSQRRRLARSVVGTSQYMAPEVIRGEMYDGRCD